MEAWLIAVITVACALGVGLVVGVVIYVKLDKKRRRRGDHDPFSIPDSDRDQERGKADDFNRPWSWSSPRFGIDSMETPTGSIFASKASLLDTMRRDFTGQQQAKFHSAHLGAYTPRFLANTTGSQSAIVGSMPGREPSYFRPFQSTQSDLAVLPSAKKYSTRNQTELGRAADPDRSKADRKNGTLKTERDSELASQPKLVSHGFQPSPMMFSEYSRPKSVKSEISSRSNAAYSISSTIPNNSRHQNRGDANVLGNKSDIEKLGKKRKIWHSFGNLIESGGEIEITDDPVHLVSTRHRERDRERDKQSKLSASQSLSNLGNPRVSGQSDDLMPGGVEQTRRDRSRNRNRDRDRDATHRNDEQRRVDPNLQGAKQAEFNHSQAKSATISGNTSVTKLDGQPLSGMVHRETGAGVTTDIDMLVLGHRNVAMTTENWETRSRAMEIVTNGVTVNGGVATSQVQSHTTVKGNSETDETSQSRPQPHLAKPSKAERTTRQSANNSTKSQTEEKTVISFFSFLEEE